jgi:hypothetical protein
MCHCSAAGLLNEALRECCKTSLRWSPQSFTRSCCSPYAVELESTLTSVAASQDLQGLAWGEQVYIRVARNVISSKFSCSFSSQSDWNTVTTLDVAQVNLRNFVDG